MSTRREPWWRLKIFGLLLSGAAAVLVAGLFVLLRSHAPPIRFEFASLQRGAPTPTVVQPLGDKFILELDLPRKEIRFLEGTLRYTGRLAAQPREVPEVIPYDFDAHGTNQAGQSVVIKGRLKLTQKVARQSPRTQADFLSAHVAGTVEIGFGLTNLLDRLSSGP